MPARDLDTHEDQAERLTEVLQARTHNLTYDDARDLVAYFLNPDLPFTIAGIRRIVNVSKPTARRYRDLLATAAEKGPEAALSAPYSIDGADPEITARYRAAANKFKGQLGAEASRAAHDDGRVDAAEMIRIIDRNLRRLDQTGAPANQLTQLAKLKIEFEDLQAERDVEAVEDPSKVLGGDGPSALAPRLIERFRTTIAHRTELPDLWRQLVTQVFLALAEDRALPPGTTPPSFLLDPPPDIVSSSPPSSLADEEVLEGEMSTPPTEEPHADD
jgi:hypothetical protein